jgi:energy-coupling factor transport system permease protein
MELRATRGRTALVPLDPRSRLALLFASGFILIKRIPLPLEVAVVSLLALLFINEQRYAAALKAVVVYAVALAVGLCVVPLLSGVSGAPAAILLAVATCTRLFMPLVLAANLLMHGITVSSFIAALRRMHLPAKLVIPLSVMFRFIPTIKEEWVSIRAAMRFKGIEISATRVLRSPLATLEYALVPLLMSTATIANELAAASLSRGLDSETERSCLLEVRLKPADYLVLALCAAFVVRVLVG